jgi:integrase
MTLQNVISGFQLDNAIKIMYPAQAAPPFTRQALAIVFGKANFKAFQKGGYPSHYWAPLLSACSGMRRNEIFFLRPADILSLDGIWIIRTPAGGSKNGRPEVMTRNIPIHATLQRLGFLAFVQERSRTHPKERLFSEYKAGQEQAGVLFSRSFVQWIKTTVSQLPADKKNLFADDYHFPSLRALFSVEAVRSGMIEGVFQELYGIGNGLRLPLGPDLSLIDAELQRMNIESYFPPIFTYEELMPESVTAGL